LRELKSFRCGAFGENGVGISKEKPLPFCLLRAEPDGVIFADPAGGKIGSLEKAEMRNFGNQIADDFGGPISGLIVDDKDFENFRLTSDGANATCDDGPSLRAGTMALMVGSVGMK